MVHEARRKNFQLLHYVTSYMGMSLCTTCKYEQGDHQNQQRNLPNGLVQAYSSEIPISGLGLVVCHCMRLRIMHAILQ